ncbi:hypothetical protein GCM10023235_37970 [Kitasatospora terrestris]|uniref:Uncharacterized protein n=1 Tax=Kitasatospora terrestris TaxID=258051 RepID=A0ABP9DTM2_9ACTN
MSFPQVSGWVRVVIAGRRVTAGRRIRPLQPTSRRNPAMLRSRLAKAAAVAALALASVPVLAATANAANIIWE